VGLWRLILEGLAVLIGCCVFRLPFGQPPVCTGDLPFGLAFQSTSDFRRRSIFRRCLPTQPPTLIGCQILRAGPSVDLQLAPSTSHIGPNLPVNLRLASPINLPAPPLHRPATRAACRSSGLPSDQSPACAFDQSSGSTFRLTYLTCVSWLTFRFRLPNLTSESHRLLHPRAAFEPIRDLRRVPILQLAFVPISGFRLRSTLRLYLPASLRLAPAANLSASPSDSTSDSHRLLNPPALPSG